VDPVVKITTTNPEKRTGLGRRCRMVANITTSTSEISQRRVGVIDCQQMTWESGLAQFGDKLRQLIDRRKLKLREFAAIVKCDHGSLSKIQNNKLQPPLKHVERWADVLGVEGAEREFFLDLAALANAPERVLRMFDPQHPAWEAIRLAAENQALKRAADEPSAYEAAQQRRAKRRSRP
jgi:transcriptional regulator with XRE-family HTH domain